MSNGPQIAMLPDGRRLHLQFGPIDMIVEADGGRHEVAAAYRQATARFRTLLPELVGELPRLRQPLAEDMAADSFRWNTARRMVEAVRLHRGVFVTPMAGVAGAGADEVLAAMTEGRRLNRAYANNGGDIAFHLADSADFTVGLIGYPETRASSGHLEPLCCPPAASPSDIPRGAMLAHRTSGITQRMAAGGQREGTRRFRPGAASRPSTVAPLRSSDRSCPRTEIAASERFQMTGKGSSEPAGRFSVTHDMPVRGVATSGRHGRSFSLGIADAVTVLARNAAAADVAATLIANRVNIDHPAIERTPAQALDPDSDLGPLPVTVAVGPLDEASRDAALDAGLASAESMCKAGLIHGAVLVLNETYRVAGPGLAKALAAAA